MTITHITPREAALERENARLLQVTRIQAMTVEAQQDEIAKLRAELAKQVALVEKCIVAMNENADNGEKAEAARYRWLRGVSEPAPAVPAGWKPVPIEPTQAMCQSGQEKALEWRAFPLRIFPIYQAMIAVAPEAK